MTRTKTNTQNGTKTSRTPRRNRLSEKKIFLCFSDFCESDCLEVLGLLLVNFNSE